MDVKANSDVKHAKNQLSAENKKRKALEKSLTDVCKYILFHVAESTHGIVCFDMYLSSLVPKKKLWLVF